LTIYWLFWGRFEKYTNDAYVGGNEVRITPQIPGIITSIYTDDNDFVEKGQMLVELDETDATLFLRAQEAELANRVREVVQLFEKRDELKAQVVVREAEVIRALLDYEHRRDLVRLGGVSKEDFEHAEIALAVSRAELVLAQHQYRAAVAEVENTTVETHPLVTRAKESLYAAWVNLKRCRLIAPVDGMIAQRRAQVGQQISPGETLLWIIPFDEIWVDANYKEVQLARLRIGQKAEVTSDLYGRKVVYHGTVQGIAGGTGSVFSLLPPQNATGNWIKIVQRLPVRIELDPEEIKSHPLRLGLSMEVTVDTRDLSGRVIPLAHHLEPIYQTDVYDRQRLGAEACIAEIIRLNRGSCPH
jgi:membrane fusion protein, multidrug efflux system